MPFPLRYYLPIRNYFSEKRSVPVSVPSDHFVTMEYADARKILEKGMVPVGQILGLSLKKIGIIVYLSISTPFQIVRNIVRVCILI